MKPKKVKYIEPEKQNLGIGDGMGEDDGEITSLKSSVSNSASKDGPVVVVTPDGQQ